jgi:hypothetical protein
MPGGGGEPILTMENYTPFSKDATHSSLVFLVLAVPAPPEGEGRNIQQIHSLT